MHQVEPIFIQGLFGDTTSLGKENFIDYDVIGYHIFGQQNQQCRVEYEVSRLNMSSFQTHLAEFTRYPIIMTCYHYTSLRL
jgi:hypothetical protein